MNSTNQHKKYKTLLIISILLMTWRFLIIIFDSSKKMWAQNYKDHSFLNSTILNLIIVIISLALTITYIFLFFKYKIKDKSLRMLNWIFIFIQIFIVILFLSFFITYHDNAMEKNYAINPNVRKVLFVLANLISSALIVIFGIKIYIYKQKLKLRKIIAEEPKELEKSKAIDNQKEINKH